jgi:hypothetical protein
MPRLRSKCKLCDEKFVNKQAKFQHVAEAHEFVKPFKCPVQNCHASFKKRQHLDDHAKTHLHCVLCEGFYYPLLGTTESMLSEEMNHLLERHEKDAKDFEDPIFDFESDSIGAALLPTRFSSFIF